MAKSRSLAFWKQSLILGLSGLMVFYGHPVWALQERGATLRVAPRVLEWVDQLEGALPNPSDLSALLAPIEPPQDASDDALPGLGSVDAHQGATGGRSNDRPAVEHPPSPPGFRYLSDQVSGSASAGRTSSDPTAANRAATSPDSPSRSDRATAALRNDVASHADGFTKTLDPNDPVPLTPGWNLVASSLEGTDPAPAVVLQSVAGAFSQAFAYDACDATDPWKLYDPADPASSDLVDLGPTVGFWIDATVPADLIPDGSVPASSTIDFCAGWNLVAFPLGQQRSVTSVLAPILDQVERVFAYDAFDVDDPWEIFDPAVPSWANDLTTLEPGRGYWVLTTASASLDVVNQGAPPEVTINAPLDLDVVTAPTPVRATVRSQLLASWTLRTREIGSGEDGWQVLASGDGPFEDTEIATFDPTLLFNGLHDLELVATDVQGVSTSADIAISVEGQMKIGHFQLEFVDLELELSGLSLQVIRQYDTRDLSPGDFGHGWDLSLARGSYQNNVTPGEGWQVLGGTLPCQQGVELEPHLTTVRLSDTEVYRFRPVLGQLAPTLGGCFAEYAYVLAGGSRPGANLEVAGNASVIYENAGTRLIDADSLEVFEPQSVVLTTREGYRFVVDLDDGVRAIEDPSGNTVTLSGAGLTHSSGNSIDFVRDSEGRLTSVEDPGGRRVTYAYDANGDLVSSTDVAGATTSYSYDANHRMTDLVDAAGRPALANVYDSGGRWTQATDAFGNTQTFDHQIADRREVTTDRLGNVTVNEYDDRGNILRTTDPLGNTVVRTYDADDNLLTQTDALGRTTSTGFSGGELTAFTNPAGTSGTLDRGPLGRIAAIDLAGSEVVSSTFDSRGNPLTLTDALGNTVVQVFDAQGNRTSVTAQDGTVTTFTYDTAGRLVEQVDPDGRRTSSVWDASGLLTERTIAAPDGTASTYTYQLDPVGRPLQITDALGNTQTFGYDAVGNLTSMTDPLGRTTNLTLDAAGRTTRVAFPDGTEEQRAYDAEGRLTSTTDRGGRTTTFEHDAAGRVTAINHPDGNRETRRYDAVGNLVELVDALGRSTTYTLDPMNRVASVTNPLGGVTSFTYDALGNVTEIEDPAGNTSTFTYDALGRRTGVQLPDGATTSTTYDAAGRIATETDPRGAVTQFGYDAAGRLSQVTDDLGGESTAEYDHLGNLVRFVDALDRETVFEYDALGRQTATVLADGSRESWAYDAVGRLTGHTTLAGDAIAFAYDDADRPIEERHNGNLVRRFGYTATGRIASAETLGAGARSFTRTYDARDRLLSEVHSTGERFDHTYDAVGNALSTSVQLGADQRTVSRTFDALDRLLSVTSGGQTTTQTWDALGNVTEVVHPNGMRANAAYDALGRVETLAWRDGTGQMLALFDYALDATGQRTSITALDGSRIDYGYDALGRLTSETRFDGGGVETGRLDWLYDAVGNRLEEQATSGGVTTSVAYTYDLIDRLTQVDGQSLTWDAGGRLVSAPLADGRSATYSWSPDDQLVGIAVDDGSSVDFGYGPLGNLRSTTADDGAGALENTDLLVDASSPLSRVVGEARSGAIDSFYTWGSLAGSSAGASASGPGSALLSVDRAAGTRYAAHDALGSVSLLTDGSGTVTDTYGYAAFGAETSHVGADANPFRFAGEWHEPNTSQVHLRARWLDTSSGRFLSRDPVPPILAETQSTSRYHYANSDPVNRLDPAGLLSPILGSLLLTAFISGLAAGLVTVGVSYISGLQNGTPPSKKELAYDFAIAFIMGFIGGLLIEVGLAAIALRVQFLKPFTILAAGGGGAAASTAISTAAGAAGRKVFLGRFNKCGIELLSAMAFEVGGVLFSLPIPEPQQEKVILEGLQQSDSIVMNLWNVKEGTFTYDIELKAILNDDSLRRKTTFTWVSPQAAINEGLLTPDDVKRCFK